MKLIILKNWNNCIKGPSEWTQYAIHKIYPFTKIVLETAKCTMNHVSLLYFDDALR